MNKNMFFRGISVAFIGYLSKNHFVKIFFLLTGCVKTIDKLMIKSNITKIN